VERYCTAGQATDVYMANAHRMLDELSLQTHTQNMSHILLFHYNNGYTNAPQCYVIRTYIVCLCNLPQSDSMPFETHSIQHILSRNLGIDVGLV